MKLIDSYQYSNKVKSWFTELTNIVQNSLYDKKSMEDNLFYDILVTKTRNQHDSLYQCDSVSFSTKDEQYNIVMIFKLLGVLIEEYERVNIAIDLAKRTTAFNDAKQNANVLRQSLTKIGVDVATLKDFTSQSMERGEYESEKETVGMVTYQFPVKTEGKVNFDRDVISGITKHIKKQQHEISMQIDSDKYGVTVDFEPKFEVSDTVEEVYASFIS